MEQETEMTRRPLRSRELVVFRRLAEWLTRAGVSPNSISAAGMVAGVLAGFALAGTGWVSGGMRAALWICGAGLIQIRLLCNMLDGMVAVEGGKRSPVGGIWNELPDRITDVATLVGAGFAVGGSPTLGWIAAVLAVLTAYVRALGASQGAGEIFNGVMSKPKRMFFVTSGALLSPFAEGVMNFMLVFIAIGSAITCVQRLAIIARRLGS